MTNRHPRLSRKDMKDVKELKDLNDVKEKSFLSFLSFISFLSFLSFQIMRAQPSRALPRPNLPRKEVIHPQVLLRMPCYDFVPINGFTLGPAKAGTSGAPIFHDVTGGVYKAQEHIHRRMADRQLLAIPASCRRVAACNPD